MSEQQDQINPEIRSLMEEKAEKHEVPVELLIKIYQEDLRRPVAWSLPSF